MLDQKALESLLQAQWTEFINRHELMLQTLKNARDAHYRISQTDHIPPKHIRLSVTKFGVSGSGFEIWVEFTVPNEDGVIIGTHVYFLSLDGSFELKDTFGTVLTPKSQ